MKKHKARRRKRQEEENAQTKRFNPQNAHQCMAEACRRANKCLGRAMICGCTIEYAAVATPESVEKWRQLRKCLTKLIARKERAKARRPPGYVEEYNIFDDPNVPTEEKEAELRRIIREKYGDD